MARNGRVLEASRRKEILRAAVEVFARKGYHGCRIADVARQAGVAYGLVYHYYRDKEALLQSVFESAWKAFLERLAEAVDSPGNLETRIRAVIGVAFEAYRADPRAVKVLILEIGRSPAGRVNRGGAFLEAIALSSKVFARAKTDGELRDDVDANLCATLLFGSVEMGLTAFVLGLLDVKDDDAIARAEAQVAELFLRGVASRKEISWKNRSATRLPAVGQ